MEKAREVQVVVEPVVVKKYPVWQYLQTETAEYCAQKATLVSEVQTPEARRKLSLH